LQLLFADIVDSLLLLLLPPAIEHKQLAFPMTEHFINIFLISSFSIWSDLKRHGER
jgi:hypothetical protein